MYMAYRYRSRRAARRLARRSKTNFVVTILLVGIIIYATIQWVLPNFIGGIGFVKNFVKPSQKVNLAVSQNSNLAPPVLNIPYEATNTAEISIKGFGTPGSKVELYIDDQPKQTIEVAGDGSFNFENVTLSLGTNNIYGTTLDEDDKESLPSKTIKLYFDNEKPPLTISEPEDDKVVAGGDKKVKIAGQTEPGAKVFINGTQIIVSGEGNFSIDQNLSDGENIISIKAVDSASNSTEEQRKVIYTP